MTGESWSNGSRAPRGREGTTPDDLTGRAAGSGKGGVTSCEQVRRMRET